MGNPSLRLSEVLRVFNPYFSPGTCPMKKLLFVDKKRVEPTLIFIEKILFSLKLFSGHFYGQSFFKTVQGPFKIISQNGSS